MSDFFSAENEEDRLAQLEKIDDKSSLWHRTGIIAAVLIALFLIIAAAGIVYFTLRPNIASISSIFSLFKGTEKNETKKVEKTQKITTKPSSNSTDKKEETLTVEPLSNLLIVGVEEIKGSKVARGFLLTKIDLKKKNIQAINIPERTYLAIPGLGLDQIGKSYSMGVATTKKTVETFTHVPVQKHIVIDYSDFEFLVIENQPRIAFEQAIDTNYTDAEKNQYLKAISKIPESKVEIIPMPVKYISVNGEPFYEPNTAEMNRLLGSLWGVTVEIKTQSVRVIILNGSGKPGVGKNMSEKISQNGYSVVDVKNASNFNYKQTQIIAYKAELIEKAKELKQVIGVGNVVLHTVTQDVADIAVIIGHDYKPLNLIETTSTASN